MVGNLSPLSLGTYSMELLSCSWRMLRLHDTQQKQTQAKIFRELQTFTGLPHRRQNRQIYRYACDFCTYCGNRDHFFPCHSLTFNGCKFNFRHTKQCLCEYFHAGFSMSYIYLLLLSRSGKDCQAGIILYLFVFRLTYLCVYIRRSGNFYN